MQYSRPGSLIRRYIACALYVLFVSILSSTALSASARENHATINIKGLSKAEKKQLHDHLQASNLLCEPRSQRKVVQQKTNNAITAALEAIGYFNAQFSILLEKDKHCWQLTVDITAGTAIVIRQVSINIIGEASQQPFFQRLLATLTPPVQSRFHSKNYDALREKIAANGLRFGYFDARFITQRVDIYPEDNAVDIAMVWNSGRRYRLGDFDIQQTSIDEQLFFTLLSIKTGDHYDYAKLQQTQQRLAESQYFSLVSIEPQLAERVRHSVPIKITATPGKQASYQAGIGFSTDTGPRLRGDYTLHRINRRGHSAQLNFLASDVLKTINLGYTMPWLEQKTDTVQSNITYIDEDNDSFRSERWESSLTASRRLNDRWLQSLSLTYSRERAVIAGETERNNHLVPALHHSMIQADDLIHPRRGYSLSATISGAAEGVLSDSTFLQLHGSVKWVAPLPANIRFLTRAELGVSLADSVEAIPASRRFFAGGDNSIRGYDYRSLGPVENGDVIGGQHLAVASVEFQRPIVGNWSIATFFDIGNAWGTDQFDDQFDLVSGTGFGLRWRSPIGPLRLDVAFPLEKPRDDTEKDIFRLHFSLGPEL